MLLIEFPPLPTFSRLPRLDDAVAYLSADLLPLSGPLELDFMSLCPRLHSTPLRAAVLHAMVPRMVTMGMKDNTSRRLKERMTASDNAWDALYMSWLQVGGELDTIYVIGYTAALAATALTAPQAAIPSCLPTLSRLPLFHH